MASCKLTRLARGLSHVVQPDHYQPRSSSQLLATLEKHVDSYGKEILEGVKDLVSLEKAILKKDAEQMEAMVKEMEAMVKEKEAKVRLLVEHGCKDRVEILRLQGINNTRGLFERMQEVLATGLTNKKGTALWEDALRTNGSLGQCVEHCTKVSANNVQKQALNIYCIYSVLSQHVHAGKELAELQAANGRILFHRGPMSQEQAKIFLCLGKAVAIDIEEDPFMRPC